MFDVSQINENELNLASGYSGASKMIDIFIEAKSEITDEIFSWVVNSPPIYASESSDKMEKIMNDHAKRYADKKEESIKLVQRVKNEFYSFLCTDSLYYKEERLKLNGDINVLIAGLATAMVTKLAGIEYGVIASFLALFIKVFGKMSKKIICDTLKNKRTK